MISASSLTTVFIIKPISGSLTTTIVESVARSISLIVVPLCHEIRTRTSFLSLITNRTFSLGSTYRCVCLANTSGLALLAAGEAVRITRAARILELDARASGHLEVPAVKRSLAFTDVKWQMTDLSRLHGMGAM